MPVVCPELCSMFASGAQAGCTVCLGMVPVQGAHADNN